MKEEQLIKLHEYEIAALDEVVRICDKYNLEYFLVGGTLLGAVRHKGFIPWDDDLDIGMPRRDLDQFERVINNELDSRFFYQSMNTENEYGHFFSKIRINNTMLIEAKDTDANKHQGISIDIFPLDIGNSHSQIIQKMRWKWINAVKRQVRMIRTKDELNGIHKVMGFFPLPFFEHIMGKWKKKQGDYYINYGSQYGLIRQTIPISKYEPPKELEFEGKFYKVPNDYDYVLKSIYGSNYMELPPIEKRTTHDPIRLSFDTNGDEEDLSDE